MGIQIEAGRDAHVQAGRDIIVGADAETLSQIYNVLDRATGDERVAEQIRSEVSALLETEDTLAQEGAKRRIMELATKLGPAVIAALSQLLPNLIK